MKSVGPVSCFFKNTTVLLMSTGRSVGQNSPIHGAVGGTNVVVPDDLVVLVFVVKLVVPFTFTVVDAVVELVVSLK